MNIFLLNHFRSHSSTVYALSYVCCWLLSLLLFCEMNRNNEKKKKNWHITNKRKRTMRPFGYTVAICDRGAHTHTRSEVPTIGFGCVIACKSSRSLIRLWRVAFHCMGVACELGVSRNHHTAHMQSRTTHDRPKMHSNKKNERTNLLF